MDFEERNVVNGAFLRRYLNGQVSIHLHLDRPVYQGTSTFFGKSTDGMEIRVNLDQALNSNIEGWIEVIGRVTSDSALYCDNVRKFLFIISNGIIICGNFQIVTYSPAPGEEAFDTASYDMLCIFMANSKDLYKMV